MAFHYLIQGFIFKKTDFGEADRFYHIFTKEFGRLKLLAKGVRKIKGKLKNQLELFNLAQVEFIEGKKNKTITDVFLINNFPNLRKNLAKLKVAFEISLLFDKFLKGQEPDEKIWQLIKTTFEELDSFKPKTTKDLKFKAQKLALIYYYFLWNFLASLGYLPNLKSCALCQKKMTSEILYFSFNNGGTICKNCKNKKKIKDIKKISANTLKLLRLILGENFQILKILKISTKDIKDLSLLSKDYLDFVQNQL